MTLVIGTWLNVSVASIIPIVVVVGSVVKLLIQYKYEE